VTGLQLLGALGVVLNQVFIWPQVRRAVGTVEGVAALSVLGGLLARSAWTAYGISQGSAALIVGNITVAAGFLLLLILLFRQGRQRLVLAGGAVGVAMVVFVLALIGGAVLGWAAAAAAAVVNMPQMLRVLTDRDRLAGVSVLTYLLIASASACWLVYGILVRQPQISAPPLLMMPSALLIAWFAARHHRGRWSPGNDRGQGAPVPDGPGSLPHPASGLPAAPTLPSAGA
jgi:uncharacterized protein with PQ loop repeat